MITPKFSIEQDDEFIIVTVKISNIRFISNDVEVNINENMLIFHLSPYYLRLRFDQQLVDDERSSANFIPGQEAILIKAPKLNKGENFSDLDLHSKLLARLSANTLPEKSSTGGNLIEEINASGNNFNDTNINMESIDKLSASIPQIAQQGEEFNWEIEQNLNVNDNELMRGIKYGFNNLYDGYIGVSLTNGNDINDIFDPEHSGAQERIKQRIQKENNSFDDEYYASEFLLQKYGSEEDKDINRINSILKFTPPLIKEYLIQKEKTDNDSSKFEFIFTEFENNQMQNNLSKKQNFLLDTEMIKLNYITILNLLFSYNFDQLENEGDKTSESVWTIGKLTPQISCLDQQLLLLSEDKTDNNNTELLKEVNLEKHQPEKPSIIKESIVTGVKRSLCYPLHRNYQLAMKAWEMVSMTLAAGKRLVIKSLLAIHELFRFHDVYYVYNKCLLDDLCAWFIAQGNDQIISALLIEFKQQLNLINKIDIEFDCIADVDMETAETYVEKINIQEIEILSEQMFKENNGI